MKRNPKILLAIGLGVVILLNVLILGWLLADFFSGANRPEETVAATDSGWETTGAPAEPIVGELSLDDAKKVIHTFSWGSRANGAVAVFRKDGNLETEFKTEQYHLFGYLISVLELGDTYIEWDLKLNIGSSVSGYRRLRYDWVENRAQITGKPEEYSNDDVPKDEDYSIVIGRHEGDIYYYPEKI